MSRSPSYRRSSFLPLFFPIPSECPAGPIRRDIPFFAEIFPFLPLYKLEKACYNIQAVNKHAPVAQWIEHRIPVPRVGGSSPFRRTKKSRYPFGYLDFLFIWETPSVSRCIPEGCRRELRTLPLPPPFTFLYPLFHLFLLMPQHFSISFIFSYFFRAFLSIKGLQF